MSLGDGVGGLGEFQSIARWTSGLPRAAGDLAGLHDDCAVLAWDGKPLLVTTDASVEGIHFNFAWYSPMDAGWRAMAGAISDIAAMGGVPRFATVSIAIPASTPVEVADGFYGGLREAAAFCGTAIIGGDTARSPSGVFVDITVLGEASDGRYLLRSGAREGDVLAVTGWPGRSAAALELFKRHGCGAAIPGDVRAAHVHPQPRLAAGRWLAACPQVHAMIDVSDGVIQDARHLAERSGIGLEVDTGATPDDDLLVRVCAEHDLDMRACYWGGGEDYELLVAVAAAEFSTVRDAFEAANTLPLVPIGAFLGAGAPVRLLGNPLRTEGHDHFA